MSESILHLPHEHHDLMDLMCHLPLHHRSVKLTTLSLLLYFIRSVKAHLIFAVPFTSPRISHITDQNAAAWCLNSYIKLEVSNYICDQTFRSGLHSTSLFLYRHIPIRAGSFPPVNNSQKKTFVAGFL